MALASSDINQLIVSSSINGIQYQDFCMHLCNLMEAKCLDCEEPTYFLLLVIF